MAPRSPRLALALAISLSLGACTAGTVRDPTSAPTSPAGAVLGEIKVAFVEDLAPQDAAQRVAPAFQGVRLALDDAVMRGGLDAAVRLVPLDTGGSPDGVREVASQIAGDPSFVAAIVGPQVSGQVALGDLLDAAGVPTLSLSTLGPDLPSQGWADWRRLVADMDLEARALAEAIGTIDGSGDVCLLGDGSPTSDALLRAVVPGLRSRPALRLDLPDTSPDDLSVISAVRSARCGSVIWGGSPAAGALLRIALVEDGLRGVRLFGGESLKDASYIATAGPAGRGTVAVCPCVDLSTSTEPKAQRFIQDYQSTFGTAPGPFAVEGWDAARMLLEAIGSGATTRPDSTRALAELRRFNGLVRTYAFASDGSLEDASAAVLVYRDQGVRWISPGNGRAP